VRFDSDRRFPFFRLGPPNPKGPCQLPRASVAAVAMSVTADAAGHDADKNLVVREGAQGHLADLELERGPDIRSFQLLSPQASPVMSPGCTMPQRRAKRRASRAVLHPELRVQGGTLFLMVCSAAKSFSAISCVLVSPGQEAQDLDFLLESSRGMACVSGSCAGVTALGGFWKSFCATLEETGRHRGAPRGWS